MSREQTITDAAQDQSATTQVDYWTDRIFNGGPLSQGEIDKLKDDWDKLNEDAQVSINLELLKQALDVIQVSFKPYHDAGVDDVDLLEAIFHAKDRAQRKNSDGMGEEDEDRENPYARFIEIVSQDDRHHAVPVVPQEIADTDAAKGVIKTWQKTRAKDELLALAIAVASLSDLYHLYRLANERGIITPAWEYVYELTEEAGWGPEPFMWQLRTILGAMYNTNERITESMAREVMEHARQGTWETVSRAAANIREDYKAGLLYANAERPELKKSLGDVDATLDRYNALREAAQTPWADDLKKAVLAHRRNGERANVEASSEIVRYMPDHAEIIAGQGPRPLMEMVLDAVSQDIDEVTIPYPVSFEGKKENVVYSVVVPKPARELIRKLPREDRTVSGLMSYGATWCQVHRDVAARTPGTGPLKMSAEMIVGARAKTRGSRFVAREYKSRVSDAHNAIDAMSYLHVDVSFPLPGGKHGHVRGPLITYLSMGAETDQKGNTTRDVWTVPRELPGFLSESALTCTEYQTLPEGDPYRQIDSAMRQYLMDQADRFYRNGGKRLAIKAAEVVNMGRKEPPKGAGETRYKVQRYELMRVPDAFDRVLPDVLAALKASGREPVRFTLKYEELKPTKQMSRRRRVIELVLTSVDSWDTAMRRVGK